jgi:hypothetical protein
MTNTTRDDRRILRLVLLAVTTALIAATWVAAPSAGAATPHYERMVQQKKVGVPLGCADLRYAAGLGIIEPVEVHWLADAGITCRNKQYIIMLVMGTKGLLACADVQWNADFGFLNGEEASDLLFRIPGCQLSQYGRLVTLLDQGLSCNDINWHADKGLLGVEQAGWLRIALNARNIACAAPAPPPASAPPAPPGGQEVPYPVTAGAFCAAADAGKYGHTSTGQLMLCSRPAGEDRYRWRQA